MPRNQSTPARVNEHASSVPIRNFYAPVGDVADTWPLMEGPTIMLMITVSYLIFVLKLGPELMKDRKPLNIKSIILVYNFYQTISNIHIVSQVSRCRGTDEC